VPAPAPLAAVQRLVQIATEALPPLLAHLAAGPLADRSPRPSPLLALRSAGKKIFEPGPVPCYQLIAKILSPVCKEAKSRAQPIDPQFR
jgi:hypothetical protein